MSALPLQRFDGKYEIVEKIREGGMGAVYKVRHRLLDEIRVIKVMRPPLAGNEQLRERFLREARVSTKLHHPNIVELYDLTTDDDGTAFIVMEYIHGRTLDEIVRAHGPLPLGLTLEIAQQSLRALGYMHRRGVVHRDVSPDNLMLTEDADGEPLVKLIDLGVARVLDGADRNLTRAGTFLGKIRYASPEQFGKAAAALPSAAGDLYSFGAVLYELLTGAHAIDGDDPSVIIAGHVLRGPVPFSKADPQGRVPPGLRNVVQKALAMTPEARYATAQDLTHDLEAFRTPNDVAADDWKPLVAGVEGGAAVRPEPGSTQIRLDERFGLVTTPTRGSLAVSEVSLTLVEPPETAPAAPPGQSADASPASAVAAAVERVEAALARGDTPAAQVDLLHAEASFGEQPALRAIRGRLAMLLRAENELATASPPVSEPPPATGEEEDLPTLLTEARRLIDLRSWGPATRLLRRADRLAPADPGVRRLQAELAASLMRGKP